jgi:hypothetical protein
MALLFSIVALLGLGLAPAVSAQNGKEVGQALCSALKAGEVQQAMGVRMDPSRDLYACYWGTSDIGDPERGVSILWHHLTMDELKAVAPDWLPLTVGGREALYDPNNRTISIGLDQGVISMTATSLQNDDWQPALTELGEILVGRSADLVAPPPADPDLAALYPVLPGEEWDLIPAYVDETFSAEFDPGKELRRALKRQGFGLADVSLIEGVARPSLGALYALRVPGADAAAFGFPATSWLMGVGWTAVPEEYADGAINTVTSATGSATAYVYPKDDVVWVVLAEEPLLSEMLAALPGAPTLPTAEEPAEEPIDEPEDEPVAGVIGDLLPTSLGGEELVTQVFEAANMGFSDPGTRVNRELQAALDSEGKTIDDVTVGSAQTADGEAGAIGVQVAGADASAFVDYAIEQVLSSLSSRKHEKEPGEVGGKAVTILRPKAAQGRVLYIYPQLDIVWIVSAPEDQLEELFAALP